MSHATHRGIRNSIVAVQFGSVGFSFIGSGRSRREGTSRGAGVASRCLMAEFPEFVALSMSRAIVSASLSMCVYL